MTEQIQELQITAVTVGAAFKKAVKKRNAANPARKETYKSILIHALSHWQVINWLQNDQSDLIDELQGLYTNGICGWNDMNEVELMHEFIHIGLGCYCVDADMSLSLMLKEYPWLVWES